MEDGGSLWGRMIFGFLWILGLAIVLLDFSYYDFLVHRENRKWKDILKSEAFWRPVHIAGILFFLGLAGSLPNLFLAGVMGAAAFLLILMIGKDRAIMRVLRRKIKKRKKGW